MSKDQDRIFMAAMELRALPICIVCRGPKGPGTVICWPCHIRQKRINADKPYDYDPVITEIMDAFEAGKVAIDNAGNITMELEGM
jgi:hypothetical protein